VTAPESDRDHLLSCRGLIFTCRRRCLIPAARHITEVTRRRLLDGLAQRRTDWSGELNDVEFLRRLYDLDALPSNDPRFRSASGDIFQHRVLNPFDWEDDWIFSDTRFGLADSDKELLNFLAEMLHPAVRTDLDEVEELRTFLNSVLIHDGYEIAQTGEISGARVFEGRRIGSGVRGSMKNIIFAAIGPKPEIVLDDAINNDLRIVKNEQNCLIYDRPLGARGLTWHDLTVWWADRKNLTSQPERTVAHSLYRRLLESIDEENGAERRIFYRYARCYRTHGYDIPALLPQVYLHYDPYTKARYQPATSPRLQRQRMDFLLLLPNSVRVVIECDGRQHYADDTGKASPQRYAAMMAGDRDLRLKGYEVYRFGGAELTDTAATRQRLDAFFDRLAERYSA
jgi:very-short-patch-repair endonuclease